MTGVAPAGDDSIVQVPKPEVGAVAFMVAVVTQTPVWFAPCTDAEGD